MIDVEKLLTDLGIEYWNGGTYNFKIFCINPDHVEKKPSMYIHKETCVLHCLGCGDSGNIFTLLHSKGIYGKDVISYLQKFSKEGYTEEEIKEALEVFVKSRGETSEQTIQYTNIELPLHRLIDSNTYLEKRGITPDEMKKWNMAVITHGKNIGWVIIPIYQGGILRTYFMRNTFGEGKLYGSYPRNDILAGLDFIASTDIIYIAEGIFDAISVSRAGFPCVACLSNRLLPAQLEHLKSFNKVVIIPDNDARGIDLVNSAGPLIHTTSLYVCELPESKKDAAECSTNEIMESCQREVMWNEFMLKNKFFQKIS